MNLAVQEPALFEVLVYPPVLSALCRSSLIASKQAHSLLVPQSSALLQWLVKSTEQLSLFGLKLQKAHSLLMLHSSALRLLLSQATVPQYCPRTPSAAGRTKVQRAQVDRNVGRS